MLREWERLKVLYKCHYTGVETLEYRLGEIWKSRRWRIEEREKRCWSFFVFPIYKTAITSALESRKLLKVTHVLIFKQFSGRSEYLLSFSYQRNIARVSVRNVWKLEGIILTYFEMLRKGKQLKRTGMLVLYCLNRFLKTSKSLVSWCSEARWVFVRPAIVQN